MAISNRAAIFTKSYKVLKKHYESVIPPERTVLEHLVYACLLENAAYDKAESAYQAIRDNAYDWNEIRVTTITELAETTKGLPDPRAAAMRLKRTLQSVFESQYSFDLEHLKKQNLGKTEKDLAKLGGTTPFTISYLTQHALGGHSIPIDDGALELFYIIGAIDAKEKQARSVPGLERAIPKKNGPEYASLLHQLAADLVHSPYSTQVKELLLEIAPDAQPRLPKRQRKKSAEDSASEAGTGEYGGGNAPTESETGKSIHRKKPSGTKKPVPDKKASAPKKKSSSKKEVSAKSGDKGDSKKTGSAKQLARRKPR